MKEQEDTLNKEISSLKSLLYEVSHFLSLFQIRDIFKLSSGTDLDSLPALLREFRHQNIQEIDIANKEI